MKDTGEAAAGLDERIKARVETLLRGSDLFVVEINVRGRKGSRVVEVFVDSDGELDVEALASLSRKLGALMEEEDLIEGKYHLNVSSPGVDRPLLSPRQFPKNVGRDLELKIDEGDAKSTVIGTLTAADAGGIEIEPKGGERKKYRYDDIAEARVKLPW